MRISLTSLALCSVVQGFVVVVNQPKRPILTPFPDPRAGMKEFGHAASKGNDDGPDHANVKACIQNDANKDDTVLLEHRGQKVVKAIFDEWPELCSPKQTPGQEEKPRTASILCGPGINGQIGVCVARLLCEHGWIVHVYLFGHDNSVESSAEPNNPAIYNDRIRINPKSTEYAVDLIIDAVHGLEDDFYKNNHNTNHHPQKPIEDSDLWEWFWQMDDALDIAALREQKWKGLNRAKIVAIDIPTGLSPETGLVIGGDPDHGLRAPRVMLTVTFQSPTPGHTMGDGPELCGKLVVCE